MKGQVYAGGVRAAAFIGRYKWLIKIVCPNGCDGRLRLSITGEPHIFKLDGGIVPPATERVVPRFACSKCCVVFEITNPNSFITKD